MEKPRTLSFAIAIAAAPLAGSAFVALAGLTWGLGLQCDESCTGEGWQHTAGAPQWTLLAVLGFVVFGCGIVLFVFVCRCRPLLALAALATGAAALFASLAPWETDWGEELQRHPLPFGALALVLLAGVFAALLCAPVER
jgi:hypothetical protein